ncbi:unnamed protein product [Ixodes pacificus]
MFSSRTSRHTSRKSSFSVTHLPKFFCVIFGMSLQHCPTSWGQFAHVHLKEDTFQLKNYIYTDVKRSFRQMSERPADVSLGDLPSSGDLALKKLGLLMKYQHAVLRST